MGKDRDDMSEAGKRILTSARQALAFARGEADAPAFRVHVPAAIDVRRIRRKAAMSQAVFARHFGVSKRTVQDWEQGRRVPTGAARAFLTVIDREPAAVRRALASSRRPRSPHQIAAE
jgi:putative transcriptional regulator